MFQPVVMALVFTLPEPVLPILPGQYLVCLL
jgi:hypothetical protein